MDAYKDTAVGFLAKFDATQSEPVEPPEPKFFRKTLGSEGTVAGYRLARSCLAGKSALAADVTLLFGELLKRAPVRLEITQ